MKIEAIDHVNIRTPDVVGTSHFFGSLLDMEVREAPGMNDVTKAAWICDTAGRPVVHVAGAEARYPFETDSTPSGPGSGRIHHVALRCTGYEECKQRLEEQGKLFYVNEVTEIQLRQIFVEEPNAIRLELNFFGD
jgi:catechol 2,3-dioxygenase-like lactoylglutathione lyase family enzyme